MGYWSDEDMYVYRTAKQIPQFSLNEWEIYGTRDEEV